MKGGEQSEIVSGLMVEKGRILGLRPCGERESIRGGNECGVVEHGGGVCVKEGRRLNGDGSGGWLAGLAGWPLDDGGRQSPWEW